MMLFAGGNIFITLSYLISGMLIVLLIAHTVWRGQTAKRKIADLTRQQNGTAPPDDNEESL